MGRLRIEPAAVDQPQGLARELTDRVFDAKHIGRDDSVARAIDVGFTGRPISAGSQRVPAASSINSKVDDLTLSTLERHPATRAS